MSAGHIDWHEDDESGLKICAVLDDSSRKILAIDELTKSEFGTGPAESNPRSTSSI